MGRAKEEKVRAQKRAICFRWNWRAHPHLPPEQPTAESITTCEDETKAMQHSKGMTQRVCDWGSACVCRYEREKGGGGRKREKNTKRERKKKMVYSWFVLKIWDFLSISYGH